MGRGSKKSSAEKKLMQECLDAIGLKAQYPKDYKKCLRFDEGLQSIAIACMVHEKSLDCSSADDGPIPNNLYEVLFNQRRSYEQIRETIASKDRMTNFGYVFKMAFALLEDTSKEGPGGRCNYGHWQTCGFSRQEFYVEGFMGFKEMIDDAGNRAEQLKAQLNAFAANSSRLGNYCCIPNELKSLGLSGLNSLKGGVGSTLFVRDSRNMEYRMNDQFSLFVDWLDWQKGNFDESDSRLIAKWKEIMVLSGKSDRPIWRKYAKAAKVYKSCFRERDYEKRLSLFAEYLALVNEAIENRCGLLPEMH